MYGLVASSALRFHYCGPARCVLHRCGYTHKHTGGKWKYYEYTITSAVAWRCDVQADFKRILLRYIEIS